MWHWSETTLTEISEGVPAVARTDNVLTDKPDTNLIGQTENY